LISLKIKNFNKELVQIKNRIRESSKKEIKKECDSLLTELIEATPIDTGFAKSQWKLVESKDSKYFFEFHNAAPYIQYLNMGTSKQAPKYFIERTVLRRAQPIGIVVQIDPDT
jgi:hypothetical protein